MKTRIYAILLIALSAINACGPETKPGENPRPPVVIDTIVVDTPKVDPPKVDTIVGQEPVNDSTYVFNPEEWAIDQGKVTDLEAIANRLKIKAAIQDAVDKGLNTFEIGKLDAYFDVSTVTSTTSNQNFYTWVEGIVLPKNFNLIMGDETFLRVQPNNKPKYSLFVAFFSDHLYVSGGNLVGERREHTYSGKGSDEWGHLFDIISSKHVTLENVVMMEGNGDGLVIHAREFTFKPNYISSEHIVVRNCSFINNRRQGISITDTEGVLIDGGLFVGTGQDLGKSKGTDPKYAIDVEAYREWSNGKVVHYERTANIVIRGITERGSYQGAIILKSGTNIIIEDNTLESGMTYHHVDNVIVRNNKIINPLGGRIGIAAGSTSQFCFDNQVIGNYIEGCDQAISISGTGNTVKHNVGVAFKSGIVMKQVSNSVIEENTMTSDVKASNALFLHVTSLENVLIKGNTFKSDRSAAQLTYINMGDDQQGYEFTIEDNDFITNQTFSIDRTKGATIKNNRLDSGFEITASTNIVLDNNDIASGSKDGVQIRGGNGYLELTNNNITTTKQCVLIREMPEKYITDNNNCLTY